MQVAGQIVAGEARRVAEIPPLRPACQRIEQRVGNLAAGRLSVCRGRQIVAHAGNVGKPGLRRLG